MEWLTLPDTALRADQPEVFVGLRVLVTGGAGFLGSWVVDELVSIGCEVSVVDSLVAQVHPIGTWPEWKNPNVAYRQLDVRDLKGITDALIAERPQCVVHLAAEVGVGQAEVEIERYVDANVRGTAVLLQAILAANGTGDKIQARDGVNRLIVAGSMSAYGEGMWLCPAHGLVRAQRLAGDLADGVWEPRCPYHETEKCENALAPVPIAEWASLRPGGVYAATKRDQEDYATLVGGSRGLSVAVPRFFNLYGPRQQPGNSYTGVVVGFGARVAAGLAPRVYEDGGQLRDFTYVVDAARAVAALVGSWQVAAAFREWSRAEQQGAFNVGTGDRMSILEVAQKACDEIGTPGMTPNLCGMVRVGDTRACFADIDRMKKLGWAPTMDVDEGLRQTFYRIVQDGVPAADLELAHVQAVTSGVAVPVQRDEVATGTPEWS